MGTDGILIEKPTPVYGVGFLVSSNRSQPGKGSSHEDPRTRGPAPYLCPADQSARAAFPVFGFSRKVRKLYTAHGEPC